MAKPKTDLAEEYKALGAIAESFSTELEHQLASLLEQKGIKAGLPIERRIKGWPAIADSIERKSLKLNSCKELPDLIALRIVVLFQRDLRRACELIEQQFKVLEREDMGAALADGQFSQDAFRYVIEVPEAWKVIPSIALGRDLHAEVHVRTLAQHVWALACHTLQYPPSTAAPLAVRRSMNRAGALLETVDLEFERALDEIEAFVKKSGTSPGQESLTTPELGMQFQALTGGEFEIDLSQQQEMDVVIEPPALQKAKSEKEAEQEQMAMRLFDTINGTKDKTRRNQMLAELKAAHQAATENAVVRRLFAKALHGVFSDLNGDYDGGRRTHLLGELRAVYQAVPEDATVRGLLARGIAQTISEANALNDVPLRNQFLSELRAMHQACPDDALVRKLFSKA